LKPGEVSLAHKGILFFDELPEFPREVLEVLRQPLEDKVINISRASGSVHYPANVMFIATMNPSPCGYYKDPEIDCKSSLAEIKRYQSKISGPLMDRIDMILEIPREKINTLLDHAKSDSSATIRDKVINAWRKQQERFAGTDIMSNADI
jgi:magnesium chelatase family protein